MQVTSLPLWNGRMGRGPPAANTMQISAALQMIVHARMGSARSRSGLPSVMRRSSTSCSDSSTIAGKEASRTMRHAPPRAGRVRHSRKSHARPMEVMGSAGRKLGVQLASNGCMASFCIDRQSMPVRGRHGGSSSSPVPLTGRTACKDARVARPPFVSIHRASAKQSTTGQDEHVPTRGTRRARDKGQGSSLLVRIGCRSALRAQSSPPLAVRQDTRVETEAGA
ncbi:hypothetical protein L1887_49888 [Cichorium endivia]|nr:hypothetical protein L1887_49888 [Cichorium endivia]